MRIICSVCKRYKASVLNSPALSGGLKSNAKCMPMIIYRTMLMNSLTVK